MTSVSCAHTVQKLRSQGKRLFIGTQFDNQFEVQAQVVVFAQETPVTDRKRLHDKAENQAREDASIRQPDFMEEHELETSTVREPYTSEHNEMTDVHEDGGCLFTFPSAIHQLLDDLLREVESGSAECTASLKRKKAEQEEGEGAAATAPPADLANEGTSPSSSAEAKASKVAAAAHFLSAEATATKQAAEAAPVGTQEGPYEGQKRARLVLSTGPAAEVRQDDGEKKRCDQEIQAVDRVIEAALIKNRIDEVGT